LTSAAEARLLAVGQPIVRLARRGTRQQVEHRERFAMQPIGGPVGRHQRAVAPDRSLLLPADALPHLATALDVFARVDHVAGLRDDSRRHRRRQPVHVASHPQENGEACDEQGTEAEPQSAGGVHAGSMTRYGVMFAAGARIAR
jgi:hypothetical protein